MVSSSGCDIDSPVSPFKRRVAWVGEALALADTALWLEGLGFDMPREPHTLN